jgi:hypothetical protein
MMDLRRRIAKEFGEPCKDVIQGCVDMGYSLTLTAETVGVSRPTVSALCKQYGITPNKRMELTPECRGKGNPGKRIETSKQTMKNRMIPDDIILAEVIKYPRARLFMKNAKYSLDCIYKRWDTFGEALLVARRSKGA